jgi:ATP-dependent Clp protease ATP-binding subunit ClpA
MFERFTDRARRVLVLAQEEARLLDYRFIGTEHILLGLLGEEDGIAARALGDVGVTLEAAREKVEERANPDNTGFSGSPPFTPRAKKVLELSLRESLRLRHNYIGTEHILLALVKEGAGVGSQVLNEMVGDISRVNEKVLALLGKEAVGPARSTVRTWPRIFAPRRAGSKREPGTPPYCQACGSGLEGKLAYSQLPAAGPGPDDPVISWTFAFCQSCGVMVGSAASGETAGGEPAGES